MGWRRRSRRRGESTSGIDEECECEYVFLLNDDYCFGCCEGTKVPALSIITFGIF